MYKIFVNYPEGLHSGKVMVNPIKTGQYLLILPDKI